ncbi:hypothetical protein BJX64DRAFT_220896 [Aspergillus heterothallicus]
MGQGLTPDTYCTVSRVFCTHGSRYSQSKSLQSPDFHLGPSPNFLGVRSPSASFEKAYTGLTVSYSIFLADLELTGCPFCLRLLTLLLLSGRPTVPTIHLLLFLFFLNKGVSGIVNWVKVDISSGGYFTAQAVKDRYDLPSAIRNVVVRLYARGIETIRGTRRVLRPERSEQLCPSGRLGCGLYRAWLLGEAVPVLREKLWKSVVFGELPHQGS